MLFDLPKPTKPVSSTAPLAWQLGPTSLADIVGQSQLIGPGQPLKQMIETDQLGSLILWGPPGCGKTSLARVIAQKTKAYYHALNAVMAKLTDIRDAIKIAQHYQHDKRTILFIDEIHRFSKTQQDALLPHVESGLLTLIGATTENPYFSVIPGLISRAQIFQLMALSNADMQIILHRINDQLSPQKKWDHEALTGVIHYAKGDARKAITLIEHIIASHESVTPSIIEKWIQSNGISSNLDTHYDLISAYIKSMRGSDPNAALYWLARLLKGGEDPVFIGRRMVIFASEDVGLADSQALPLAMAAHQATQSIGMPEVQINLSHVTTYLANAPKSNRTYRAIQKANEWIDKGHVYPVPIHLRDAHYKGAHALGHGVGYHYSHNPTDKKQAYLPQRVTFLDDV